MISTSCFGYFFHGEKLSNDQHNIFLFSDQHDLVPYAPREEKRMACNKQRKKLMDEAKKLNAFVIVEDILFGNDKYSKSPLEKLSDKIRDDYRKDPFAFNPNGDYSKFTPDIAEVEDKSYQVVSPLFFLSQFCKKDEIRVENVEFRFVGLDKQISDNMSVLNKNTSDIEGFKGDDQWKSIRKEAIDSHRAKLAEFDQLNRKMVSAEGEVTQNIIDLKIIQSIYSHPDIKNIFICAGAEHIKNIRVILIDRLGYKNKSECGSLVFPKFEDPQAIDLQKCFHQFR